MLHAEWRQRAAPDRGTLPTRLALPEWRLQGRLPGDVDGRALAETLKARALALCDEPIASSAPIALPLHVACAQAMLVVSASP